VRLFGRPPADEYLRLDRVVPRPGAGADHPALHPTARYPNDLRFGICWQHGSDEARPLEFEDRRLRVLDVLWHQSRGACWARSEIMKLYSSDQEIHHEDAGGEELRRLVTGNTAKIVIERKFRSARPPATWTVWPVNAGGEWLSKTVGDVTTPALIART
jgi:hypothetical protein